MENSNYLSLSEIILGLRKEYVKTYNELAALKNYLNLENGVKASFGIYSKKNVKDIDNADKNIDVYYLIIDLEKKLNVLESILNFVSRDNYKVDNVIYNETGVRRNFVSINDKRLFNVEDSKNFRIDCNKILLSDFNTGLNDKYETVNDEGLKVKIGHNGVYAVTDMKSSSNPVIGVDYYAGADQLVLNNYYGDPFFGDKARRILSTRVPANSIDTNLVSMISSNPVSELPIEFDGLTNTRAPQYFKLIEEPGRVLAKRI